ncbi:MAG: integrase arm-type DNA-binding domain-containing protein [Amphiplicatus sp.]
MNALTALIVKNASRPGRYADGNGLYLVVDPSGAKRWLLRTLVQGRRRDIGLGGLKTVSLAEARAKAAALRAIARDGGDPVAARRIERIIVPTFEAAAAKIHSEHSAAWKNRKHRDQWINTLKEYAFPYFGARPVNQIATPDVLKALGPIWLTKPETARRLRQRIATVFDWAKAAGHLDGENPVSGVARGLPKQPERKKHHRATPFGDVPALVGNLRCEESDRASALALEFLILNGTRTSETLDAKWSEIDEKSAVWTIPAERMKAGREHRIPLSKRAIEVLKAARKSLPQSDFVFPGAKEGKPLSSMALLMKLRRTGSTATVHGFRSAFRDWAAERTNFSREVCEMALAHTIANKVEAAYRRGDLFEKRRKLMEAWGAYVSTEPAKVIRLKAAF